MELNGLKETLNYYKIKIFNNKRISYCQIKALTIDYNNSLKFFFYNFKKQKLN